jgi:glyoxylase-like metal-dependent hydrolase (beta-lactamase superfamily II)
MQPAFHIGQYPVWRIEEWAGQFALPRDLFAEFEEHAFAAVREGFVPDYLQDDNIYAFLQSWLIDAGGLKVLVDTGAGNGKERPGIPVFGGLRTDFMTRFAQTGFKPEDIDIVVCTHLHIDHVGWNTRWHDSAWVPTFPKARYLFPAIDREAWDPAKSLYAKLRGREVNANVFEDSVQPILDAGLADCVEDGFSVAPGMVLHNTPGHTPGHMMLEVSDADDTALFTGDILHHPMQIFRPDWNSVYCENRAEAAATRRGVVERAAKTGARIVPAHFGGQHSIFVERVGEGFRPVEPS